MNKYWNDKDRGTGRTTAALKAAPPNCIYIVSVHAAIYYTVRLAHSLARGDIRVVNTQFVLEERHRGLNVPLVLDHAAMWHLNAYQVDKLHIFVAQHNYRFKKDKP